MPSPPTKPAAPPGSFLLTSSLNAVEEVLVVDNASTAGVVAALGPAVQAAGARLTPIHVPNGLERDLWMQDAVETRCIVPSDPGSPAPWAVLTGRRSLYEDLDCSILDRCVRDHFDHRGIRCLDVAEARPDTRWIDWYGNLEVSPPVVAADGTPYPFGRVLSGRQRDLSLHPGVIEFLERQGLQTPPIVIDTSWLLIGHVDEVVNFVPAEAEPGFRVPIPSPTCAVNLLEELVSAGHSHSVVFAGRERQGTVRQLLETVGRADESPEIDQILQSTRELLCHEIGFTSD